MKFSFVQDMMGRKQRKDCQEVLMGFLALGKEEKVMEYEVMEYEAKCIVFCGTKLRCVPRQ